MFQFLYTYVHVYCSFICSVATKTPLMGGLTGSYLISTMIGENSVKLIPLLDTMITFFQHARAQQYVW